jgi:tetratricopeptide (TPR) repeat protein
MALLRVARGRRRLLVIILAGVLAGRAAAVEPALSQRQYEQALMAGNRALAAGRLDVAERSYRQALINVERQEPLGVSLDQSQRRLVSVYVRRNRLATLEAEATAELASREREHGRDDPSVAPPLGLLALIANEHGRYDQAIGYLERIHAVGEKAGFARDGVTMSMLAFCRFAQGDTAGGLAARAMALDELMAVVVPDPYQDAVWLADWGWLDAANGKLPRAQKSFARALHDLGALVGDTHPNVATLWEAQAAVLARLHRPREAKRASARAAMLRERIR